MQTVYYTVQDNVNLSTRRLTVSETGSQLTTVRIDGWPYVVVRPSSIEAAVPLNSRLILRKAIDADKDATESIVI